MKVAMIVYADAMPVNGTEPLTLCDSIEQSVESLLPTAVMSEGSEGQLVLCPVKWAGVTVRPLVEQ